MNHGIYHLFYHPFSPIHQGPQQELLADEVELNQLPQPCELTLVLQHPGWDGICGTKHDLIDGEVLQIAPVICGFFHRTQV